MGESAGRSRRMKRTMGESAGKISLKLLVDKNEKRVIFGEAGKEFVDFLFHFLSLPLGTVVTLLSKDKMVGSLGKLFDSIEAMNDNYMEPDVNKDEVLNPKVSSGFVANTPLLCNSKKTTSIEVDEASKTYYTSGYQAYSSHLYVSTDPAAKCPSCQNHMNRNLTYVQGPAKVVPKVTKEATGYVKGLVTYMITDDLVVKPMSNICSIALLSRLKVKDLSVLETMEVFIGKDEAVELLKASLTTDKVLTSLFLGTDKKA